MEITKKEKQLIETKNMLEVKNMEDTCNKSKGFFELTNEAILTAALQNSDEYISFKMVANNMRLLFFPQYEGTYAAMIISDYNQNNEKNENHHSKGKNNVRKQIFRNNIFLDFSSLSDTIQKVLKYFKIE